MTKSNYYITITNKNVNGYTITLKYLKKGVIFIFTCNNSLISFPSLRFFINVNLKLISKNLRINIELIKKPKLLKLKDK